MTRIGTLVGAAVLLFALASFAQDVAPINPLVRRSSSNIVVQTSAMNCTTTLGQGAFDALSWSFGATEVTDPSSGLAGKAMVEALNVSKDWDECSPVLFGDTVAGTIFKSVTLTQSDKKGNVLLTVKLTNALLTSFQIGGARSDTRPVENLSFDFEKICIQETNGGAIACFNKGASSGQ